MKQKVWTRNNICFTEYTSNSNITVIDKSKTNILTLFAIMSF